MSDEAYKKQIFELMVKHHIDDRNQLLQVLSEMITKKTGKNLGLRLIEAKFGKIIDECLAKFNQLKKEGKIQPPERDEDKNVDPVIKERNKLFFRSGIKILEQIIENAIEHILSEDTEYNEEIRKEIIDELLPYHYKIIDISKTATNWSDILPFIEKYVDYHINHRDEYQEYRLGEEDKRVESEIARMLKNTYLKSEKPKEEEENQQNKRRVRINIAKYIEDDEMKREYYSKMKEFIKDKVRDDNRFLRSREYAESFYDAYKGLFKSDLPSEDQAKLMKGLSGKAEVIVKHLGQLELFNEKQEQIRNGIIKTIEKVIEHKSSYDFYLKSEASTILNRLFQLLCNDPQVGGVVINFRKETLPIIEEVIKEKFLKQKIFKKFR